jgi:XTP/dITP diphosphohydrolase
VAAIAKLLLASSNAGKLAEFQAMAASEPRTISVQLALLPNFSALPQFDESAPTFGENAAGKAAHYSRYADDPVLADDSGLVVPALGGAPGVHSARYAGPGASDADKIRKLLAEMRGMTGAQRTARFVCVLAVAKQGRVTTVISDFVEGELPDAPRGTGGFGYDPVFLIKGMGKTFAELSREEKNLLSHRGKAFRRLFNAIASSR